MIYRPLQKITCAWVAMINFNIGGENGFNAECNGNDTAEVVIASAVGVSLLLLAGAGAYSLVSGSAGSSSISDIVDIAVDQTSKP